MKPKVGYDDQTVADEVEGAYDADVERQLRRRLTALKWGRRVGSCLGVISLVLLAVLFYVVVVNFVHAFVWLVVWVWGWWG